MFPFVLGGGENLRWSSEPFDEVDSIGFFWAGRWGGWIGTNGDQRTVGASRWGCRIGRDGNVFVTSKNCLVTKGFLQILGKSRLVKYDEIHPNSCLFFLMTKPYPETFFRSGGNHPWNWVAGLRFGEKDSQGSTGVSLFGVNMTFFVNLPFISILYFGVWTLQKKTLSIQTKGHLGSRYIYIYIYIYITLTLPWIFKNLLIRKIYHRRRVDSSHLFVVTTSSWDFVVVVIITSFFFVFLLGGGFGFSPVPEICTIMRASAGNKENFGLAMLPGWPLADLKAAVRHRSRSCTVFWHWGWVLRRLKGVP